MVCSLHAVVAGVQDDRAGLDHVPRDHARASHGGAEDVGLTGDLGEVRGPRVADGNGGIFLQQQQGQRLA